MAPRTKASFAEIEPDYSLRHYQKQAVEAARGELRTHGRVLLHAPTGSGKTRMAMAIVSMHLRDRGPTMVLWLAPSSELIEQAADAFADTWRSHGDVKCAVAQWWGEGEAFSHSMTLDRNTMVVAGIQMAVQSVEKIPRSLRVLRERASLVVFDEAHQSVAPTYRDLVEKVIDAPGRERQLLGLSATPGRANPSETKALAEMYGDHKVGIGAPGSNPMRYLVSEGYLARATVHVQSLADTPGPSKGRRNAEYADADLRALGKIDVRNEAIVDLVKGLIADNHRRIIAFTPSVHAAKRCAELLRRNDVPYAHAVHGDMPQASRNHILNTYRASTKDNPNPQVIFNCRLLTAGVDLPQTSAVVIGKPTKSDVLLQQMIGRALRGSKSGGNSEADIRILADDSYEDFGDLAAMFSEWDELWEPQPNETA